LKITVIRTILNSENTYLKKAETQFQGKSGLKIYHFLGKL